MSTRHTTASRCQVCVRPHLCVVKTRWLNAPLCLNLSCWLYGNDASQAKHNKPLVSSACRQQCWEDGDLTTVCVCELDRHWECRFVYKYEIELNDVITSYCIKQFILQLCSLKLLVWTQSGQQAWFLVEQNSDFRAVWASCHKSYPSLFFTPIMYPQFGGQTSVTAFSYLSQPSCDL